MSSMDADREMLRLWNLVSEIAEQVNQNKAITERLLANAGQIHLYLLRSIVDAFKEEHAGHTSDGATLRRFNTDLSKEIFTSELERFSVALVMENQTLLHENKQLTSLMQEYEQTLETVMCKLRGHCQTVQTHQLTLNRHYETLLSRDREDILAQNGIDPMHLRSLTVLIRRALSSMAGKDPLEEEQFDREAEIRGELQESELEEQEDEWNGVGWAEEREFEIQRLEQENAQLRHALGISVEQERELGLADTEQTTQLPSPFSDRSSTSRPSFGGDRGRGSGRLGNGPFGGGGPQRRSGPLASIRRGPGDRGAMPDRVASPPNDPRWEPLVESI